MAFNDSVQIVKGGMLIDSVGESPIKDSILVIEGDKILNVGTKDTIDIQRVKSLTLLEWWSCLD